MHRPFRRCATCGNRRTWVGRRPIGGNWYADICLANLAVCNSRAVSTLPSDLLQAVAERSGRIALIIGAGCSLDAPTSLSLGSEYSLDAHRKLLADGVLEPGDCDTPWDLSALASCVHAKTGGQTPLVTRLPLAAFRHALPNTGYLTVVALLREGAIDSVLTLNFDLALSKGVADLSGHEISMITGPGVTSQFSAGSVIYLHRSVEENDLEQWILTSEALNAGWQDTWQEVIAARSLSCPVVVFAGLGSRAAVLTATVAKIKLSLSNGQHHEFLVDPSQDSEFKAELALPPSAHIQLGWCEFMNELGSRVVEELVHLLDGAARHMCDANQWDVPGRSLEVVLAALGAFDLVRFGKNRARWLLADEMYTPDDQYGRAHVADLILGLAEVLRDASDHLSFDRDGLAVVEANDGGAQIRVKLASGNGVLRWPALEAKLIAKSAADEASPDVVLVAGVDGTRPESGPPVDLMGELEEGDLVAGPIPARLVHVDEVRADPSIIWELV